MRDRRFETSGQAAGPGHTGRRGPGEAGPKDTGSEHQARIKPLAFSLAPPGRPGGWQPLTPRLWPAGGHHAGLHSAPPTAARHAPPRPALLLPRSQLPRPGPPPPTRRPLPFTPGPRGPGPRLPPQRRGQEVSSRGGNPSLVRGVRPGTDGAPRLEAAGFAQSHGCYTAAGTFIPPRGPRRPAGHLTPLRATERSPGRVGSPGPAHG